MKNYRNRNYLTGDDVPELADSSAWLDYQCAVLGGKRGYGGAPYGGHWLRLPCGVSGPSQPQAAHTPGPWSLSGSDDCIMAKSARYGQSGGKVVVARIPRHQTGSTDCICPDEIQDANARLIAAAPELLAALKCAETQLRQLEANHSDAWHDSEKEDAQSALEQIRAALARATQP